MNNDTGVDFCKLQNDLEAQELEAPGGVGSPQLYSQLLALYLLHNETCNAKFLWKRIPQAIKSTTPELATIWNTGQKLWLRDYPGIYESLKKEWSENVKFIMEALVDSTRRRAANIVARAYSSINEEDLAAFLGMSASEAVQTAVSEGWQYDAQTKFVTPKRIDDGYMATVIRGWKNVFARDEWELLQELQCY